VLYDSITKESISSALKTVLSDPRWVASDSNRFCY
jgi:hypothetical protein